MLFDYVHLLKNICNLWLTEKIGELIFDNDGVRRVAKWAHLKQLYRFESERLVKLSDLNEISIAPKPIERQRVFTCLRVFSEKKNQVSSASHKIACCALNSRFGSLSLSPREVLYQRDQFTDERIHFNDMDLIDQRHRRRTSNHAPNDPKPSNRSR